MFIIETYSLQLKRPVSTKCSKQWIYVVYMFRYSIPDVVFVLH